MAPIILSKQETKRKLSFFLLHKEAEGNRNDPKPTLGLIGEFKIRRVEG